MTEHRARAVEEPVGYDYPSTDRIPVPGDLSDERTDHQADDRMDGGADDWTDDRASDRIDDRADHGADGWTDDGTDPRVDGEVGRQSSDLDTPAHAAAPGAAVEPPATYGEPVGTPVEPTGTEELPRQPATGAGTTENEQEFFDDNEVDRFRDRWRELQASFVDDPAQAVRGANDLVDEIMHELAERKDHLDDKWRDASDGKVGTEELRVVIREYRAFFDRLLNA